MKKGIALLMVVTCLVLTLVGCGKNSKNPASGENETPPPNFSGEIHG